MPRKNIYDWFIIFVLASFVMGAVQVWIFSQAVVVGLISLPFALKEIISSFSSAKFKSIILFLMIWLLYAAISVFWTLAPEPWVNLWQLFWEMTIFLALFHSVSRANFPIRSFMQGWLMLLLFTFPIAFWEISTGKHLEKWGDFNADSSIALASGGSQQRVFAAVTYVNLNSYVTLLCMALPIVFASIFELKCKIYPVLVAFVAVCLVLINSSRGGMVCILADMLVLFYFYQKSRFRYKTLVTVLIVVSIGFFVVNFGFLVIDQLLGRLENVDSFVQDIGRWEVLQLGFQLLYDSGGLGWGVGSMAPAYETTGFWLHYAHNMVMEFWVQYGLFLSIPFGWLGLKAFLNLLRNPHFSLRVYGWVLVCSFLPLIIIDDSYFVRSFFWGYLATIFCMCEIREN